MVMRIQMMRPTQMKRMTQMETKALKEPINGKSQRRQHVEDSEFYALIDAVYVPQHSRPSY
jgi:hypothetical protein